MAQARGAIVAVGDDGFIAFATPAALQLLGWDASLVGKPQQTIVPLRLRDRHRAGLKAFVVSRHHKLHYPAREPALCQDGSEREIDIVVIGFRRPDGSMFLCSTLGAPGGAAPSLGDVELNLSASGYQRLRH